MFISLIKQTVTLLFSLDYRMKRLILFGYDSVLIPLSLVLAMLSRLESYQFLFQIESYIACGISYACTMTAFYSRGFYRSFTRHATIDTAITIILGVTVSALVLFTFIFSIGLQVPLSVPLIQSAFLIIGISGLRILIRGIGQNINYGTRKNIAIYGAGVTGRQLIEALKWNTQYRVCQLIDDNPKLRGQSLAGLTIESFDDARKKLELHEIDTILLAMPSTSYSSHRRIFNLLTDMPVKIKSIPNLTSLIAGTADITNLPDIDIVELLNRDQAKPDPHLLGKTVTSKTVLVTGAGGSIGSELSRQIAAQTPAHLLLLDISEFAIYGLLQELHALFPTLKITPIIGSVQDQPFCVNVLKQFSINTVYHAAAYKHVPLMEQNVMQCISNNVFGTKNMAVAAVEAEVEYFTLISTDKAVNPTNFMGASKRLAELVCLDLANTQTITRFAIVRFGNVLGSSGSVVPLFKQQIATGGPVTVTHPDVVRYFMTIPEAAQLVIQAGSLTKGGDIFVLDMGEPVKILDLAKKMITLSGKKPSMEFETWTGANQIAIRITGLRPGEKMFEELSYNDNLTGTSHPRIMTTDDQSLTGNALTKLLNDTIDAVASDDHEKLFRTIRQVSNGVANNKTSGDVFYNNRRR